MPVYLFGGFLGVLGIVAMESLKSYLRNEGYVV